MWLRHALLILLALAFLSARPAKKSRTRRARQAARKAVVKLPHMPGTLEQTVRRWESRGGQLTGVVVVSLKDDSIVFAHNATKPMVPASNQKLVVTAAAWSHWDSGLVAQMRQKFRPRRPATVNPTGRTRAAQARAARALKQAAVDSLLNAFPEDDSLTGLPGYDLLCRIHKWSDNKMANHLLKCVTDREGRSGQELVQGFLDSLGIWAGGLNVVDGSGRSPANRIAPLTLAQTLHAMHHSPRREAYRRSLARAGAEGTLRKHGFDLGDCVLAKTGSIGGVFSLSGYLDTGGDTLAFVMLLNECWDKNGAFTFFGDILQRLAREEASS